MGTETELQSCGEGNIELLAARSLALCRCDRWTPVGQGGEERGGLDKNCPAGELAARNHNGAADTLAPHATRLGPPRVAVEIEGQGVIFPAAAGPRGCLAQLVALNKECW